MPTSLPNRQSKSAETRDPGWRDVMIAGAILLSVLCLVCEHTLGPTSGYSLVDTPGQLQLSP
jgi:hypothetical protein